MNLLVKESECKWQMCCTGWILWCTAQTLPRRTQTPVPLAVGRAGCWPHNCILSCNRPWPKWATIPNFTSPPQKRQPVSTHCSTWWSKDPVPLPRFRTNQGAILASEVPVGSAEVSASTVWKFIFSAIPLLLTLSQVCSREDLLQVNLLHADLCSVFQGI